MKVLIASSEVTPFAKTGGLADVCRDLPLALAKRGHEVAIMLPAYRSVLRGGFELEDTGCRLELPIGSKIVDGTIWKTHLPADTVGGQSSGIAPVPVYLIRQDKYFDRDGLYQEAGADYRDNCERFVFYCKAVMEAPRLLGLRFDVLHANDWQTGLLPAYLATEFAGVPEWENTASIFTIHNLAFQGAFWHWDMLLTGMDWKYFNWQQMEYFGDLNLMKTGLTFADGLTTVSPKYAQEVQTEEQGRGLESVLRHRGDDLVGILNGINEDEWNPATDRLAPATFTPEDLSGKAICKSTLQRETRLPERDDIPLIGFIGRLSEQKGVDLAVSAARTWASAEAAQFVFLGTGEARFHEQLQALANEFPHLIAARLQFSSEMAHLIEAGCDMFLMPSRYEPCGLNQMFSLKYGAVPIVHHTGGLADTVTNTTPTTLQDASANGFSFSPYGVQSLNDAIRRALDAFFDKDVWTRIMQTGMKQDWSWRRSAADYETLYRRMVAKKGEGVRA